MGYKDYTTDYSEKMSAKTSKYDALICKAEMLHRDNKNEVSKKEASYYLEAARVCEEIASMNIGQRAVANKWNARKEDCMEKIDSIMAIIEPSKKKPADVKSESGSDEELNEGAVSKNENSGGVKVTSSGFKTKNSCQEVTAETIEKWYAEKPNHGFDSISGMEKERKLLNKIVEDNDWKEIDSFINYKSVNSILFYGIPGCGKTFVIEAFIKELMDKGYKYIRLKGSDIHSSYVGVGQKVIDIAFKEAMDNEPCVFFIDEFDEVCVDRNIENVAEYSKQATITFLQSYDSLLQHKEKNVIFLCATNYPASIDAAMRSRIYPVYVPLPDAKARTSYFEKKLENITLSGMDYVYIAKRTAECSYRDLDKIISFLIGGFREQAIEKSKVLSESGELDKQATQNAAITAIKEGKIKLDKELFESVMNDYSVEDKSESFESLKAFRRDLAKENDNYEYEDIESLEAPDDGAFKKDEAAKPKPTVTPVKTGGVSKVKPMLRPAKS